MGITKKKNARRARVRRGIRAKISGTSSRPRLTVYRSNKHIYAQLIDDTTGNTLAAASSQESAADGDKPSTLANSVGKLVGERAKEAGIKSVVFDRNGYRYHGRVKGLAEGVRESGIEI
ncbi:MAG: 50S ribosomal protein L18 [Rhodothermales bacterium]|nr:50S ribosomal protein L18 [Rhodothermales bacterium]